MRVLTVVITALPGRDGGEGCNRFQPRDELFAHQTLGLPI